MTSEGSGITGATSLRDELMDDDGRAPLVLAAGLVAALVSGALWAGLVFVTEMEIGYAAWGVGLLVGLAMSRVTVRRTQQLAYIAAALAVLGLLTGKALIFTGSAGRIAEEFEKGDGVLTGAIAWDMYAARELDEPTLAAVDAVEEAGDTLSDAVWADMTTQASARLERMSAQERHEAAVMASRRVMQSMGVAGGILAQVTLFDALWLFLAVGTAFRMLAPPKREMAEAPAVSA